MTAAGPLAEADRSKDPAVARFIRDAKEFCRLLESESALTQREVLQQLLLAMALYRTGLALSEVDPELDARRSRCLTRTPDRCFGSSSLSGSTATYLIPRVRTRPPSPATLRAFTWP